MNAKLLNFANTYFVLVVVVSGFLSLSANAQAQPTWVGYYAGLNMGQSTLNSDWNTGSSIGSVFGINTADATAHQAFNSSDWSAGGYAGYNWQSDKWVSGIEGDIGQAHNNKTTAGIPGCIINCGGLPGPANDASSVKLGWNAGVRARLGYLVADDALMFGTAGVALQSVTSSATCQLSAPDPVCLVAPGNPYSTSATNHTLVGYTVGAGAEKLLGDWTLRAEYKYSQFGNASTMARFSDGSVVQYGLKVNTQVATLGLAYKFK